MASGYIAGGALAAIVIAILQGVPRPGPGGLQQSVEDWATLHNPLVPWRQCRYVVDDSVPDPDALAILGRARSPSHEQASRREAALMDSCITSDCELTLWQYPRRAAKHGARLIFINTEDKFDASFNFTVRDFLRRVLVVGLLSCLVRCAL